MHKFKDKVLTKVSFLCLLGLLGMFSVGCSTTSTDTTIDAYKLGRLTAVAYLSQKSTLTENDIKVITEVYKQFDVFINQDTSMDSVTGINFKDLLIKAIVAKSSLKESDITLVTTLLDLYWEKLSTYYKIDTVIGVERLAILKEFNLGIKEALKDYNFLSSK